MNLLNGSYQKKKKNLLNVNRSLMGLLLVQSNYFLQFHLCSLSTDYHFLRLYIFFSLSPSRILASSTKHKRKVGRDRAVKSYILQSIVLTWPVLQILDNPHPRKFSKTDPQNPWAGIGPHTRTYDFAWRPVLLVDCHPDLVTAIPSIPVLIP